MGSTAAAGA
uniref:Uncharacterized protein n=1 Tax=Arundo donax TaxID=35708 RepID=A0A0A9CES6_ARUDO